MTLEKGIVDIITPNGVTFKAVIMDICDQHIDEFREIIKTYYLCYAQNRMFYLRETHYMESYWYDDEIGEEGTIPGRSEYQFGEVLVEYCTVPLYDIMLRDEESIGIIDMYKGED